MAKKNWIVRPYEAGDEQGILNLFNEVFSEVNPDFEHRTLKEWYWQFRDSPMGNQTTVAVDEDGRVYMVDQYFKKVDVFRPADLPEDEGWLSSVRATKK